MSDQTNNDEPRDARDTIESQAEAGDIEAAIATSRTIEDTEKREDTLRDVAKSLAKDEQGDAAIALAKGIDNLTIRVWALDEIGTELRSQHRPTEALSALGAQMHTEESLEPEQRRVVSGCVEPRINGEQRSPLGVIRGAGGDSERWVGV